MTETAPTCRLGYARVSTCGKRWAAELDHRGGRTTTAATLPTLPRGTATVTA